MENSAEYKNNLGELLGIALKLKKELHESYSAMRLNFNPLENAGIFNGKKKALNELIEKLKSMSLNGYVLQNGEAADEETEDLKSDIRAAVSEIDKINESFSRLIKKNMYYNQLTISFIADAFSRSSIYNRAGSNDSRFFPLKNVLIGAGLKI